jgi:multisubunit Na+/H+ antiporter MnhB subunit
MVEWTSLAFNGLWVVGAAIILATFSFSYYEAQRRGERPRAHLAAPGVQVWLFTGVVLISLGAVLLVPRWWERVLWGLLGMLSIWQLAVAWRERRTGGN